MFCSCRFIVREFKYNEEELAAGKNEITKLVTDKKKQFVSFPWLQDFKADCSGVTFAILNFRVPWYVG